MISIEKLFHFSCEFCNKWWTIGDAEPERQYFCPWCGKEQPKVLWLDKLEK